MIIDIYKSDIKNNLYLSVPANTDVGILLPRLGPDYRMVKLQKAGENISPDDKRVAFNSHEIIAAIDRDGYALHEANVTLTIADQR
jgi:hypothetical protein